MCPLREEGDNISGSSLSRAHQLLVEVCGDHLHHNDRVHLYRGLFDDVLCQRFWCQLVSQSDSCHTTPLGEIFVLTNILCAYHAREIWARIGRRLYHWGRGHHMELIVDMEAEGIAIEGWSVRNK